MSVPVGSVVLRRCALVVLVALGIGARPALAGFGHDPYNPVMVTPLSLNTMFGSAASDGAGGMFVAWDDMHAGGPHIYLERYTGTGDLAAGWPAGGVLVSGTSGIQSGPVLLADGTGGVLVAWNDSRGSSQDIYAAHVLASGALAPGWPATGVLVSSNSVSATLYDTSPVLATDGAGGAIVVWTLLYSSTDDDVYGARVTAGGVVAWNFGLYAPIGHQDQPKVVADGAGGFLVAFEDDGNTANSHAKVAHFNSSGTTTWGPLFVGTTGNNQWNVDLASDGAGGAYAVCTDYGFGAYSNITANHYLASGVSDPNWGGYRTIAPEPNLSQGGPLALADGSGGLLTVFSDPRYGSPDLFVQRTGAYGVAYSGWPAGGVALAVAPVNQDPCSVISDGAGGAIVAFLDDRSYIDYFLYAARVLADGTMAPGWIYGGNAVDLGGMIDTPFKQPVAVPDGSGGALFAWSDMRGTNSYGYSGVYAQNVDRFGALGDARPAITRVADVPNDQGGAVSLQWTASYLDAPPSRTVTQYSVWRRVPGGTAAAAARRASVPDGRPTWRTTVEGADVVYWEYVSTEPARMLPGYSVVVPTTSDSMATANPRTAFMVFAESPGATMFWPSRPDSGYSVDNVPPYPPAPFLGTFSAGATSMHWRADVVADLAGYRLYRGTSASFVPGPSNFVAAPIDTAYSDAAGAPYYYRLTAIDTHGNESASTLLLPAGALGVDDGALPREVALARPQPNPAHGATVLRFALPRDAAVRLELYDASGRRVRVLAAGMSTAGEHAVAWDLRDDAGHAVGAGLYFARLEADGRVFTQRVMALR